MNSVDLMKIAPAAIRLLGMFAIFDIYFTKKQNAFLITVVIGWFFYAVAPIISVLPGNITGLSFLNGIFGLTGVFLIFAGIISYFIDIKTKQIFYGATFIVSVLLVLLFSGVSVSSFNDIIISGQLLILLISSIYGIIRWKKYRVIASTGTLWLISILILAILLCVFYLLSPQNNQLVVLTISHLIVSLLTIIYFLNMEYNIAHYKTKEHEERLNAILNSSPNAIVQTKITGEITSCNSATIDMYRCSSEKDILGKNVIDFFIPTDESYLEEYRENLLEEGVVRDIAFTGLDFTGREFPVKISTGVIKNLSNEPVNLVTITRDITSEIAAEKKLQYSLEEKDILLAEINSRVKNNLTLISSLLGLQLIDNDNSKIEDLIIKSQQRIHSMALIHEKLYESKNFNDMDIEGYLERLIDYLVESYRYVGSEMGYVLDIDRISINMDSLIPLGLILNEIITNSLIHGFIDTEAPFIWIRMKMENTETVSLYVSDNGCGIQNKDVLRNKKTLGIMIIESLTDQLHGTCEVDGTSGTSWNLLFSGKVGN